MTATSSSRAKQIWRHLAPRDRDELKLLVGAIVLVGVSLLLLFLVGKIRDGDTQAFDEEILKALRRADDPRRPIGPAWMTLGAEDITALGGPTVLGLAVLAVTGFLALQGMYRNALFVFATSVGAWFLNDLLKDLFG